MPGPTQNNRLFFHCGSVAGLCTNFDRNKVLKGLPSTTMYKKLQDQKISWKVYMHDLSSLLYFKDFRSFRMLSNLHLMNQFFKDSSAGKLPAFSFIEPRYFDILAWRANDQHPSHPVPYGEQLIKDIYESLRASPKWEKTALVITYDEHGGFYDHVVPPMWAPDSESPTFGPCTADGGGPKGFRYNRMGLRVPFIVVSPWTPAKLFNKLESSQKPEKTSVLEHTSVWQTLKKLFGAQGDLSIRSKWAADFANWFSLEKPRTDHPMKLPNAAAVRPNDNNQQNGLQHDFTILVSLLIGVPPPQGMPETKAGEFVISAVAKAKSILEKFQAAKDIVVNKVQQTGTQIVNGVRQTTTTVVNGVKQVGTTVTQGAKQAAQATVNSIKSAYSWLTGGFIETAAAHGIHITEDMTLEELHAAIEARNAKIVKSWQDVKGYAKAPHHRAGRAGHNTQGSLNPSDDARFAEAETDAEAKVSANMPIRAANGELIGPNAANPLFDVETYIENGPFFMPGILSAEADDQGVPDKIFDVFHDV